MQVNVDKRFYIENKHPSPPNPHWYQSQGLKIIVQYQVYELCTYITLQKIFPCKKNSNDVTKNILFTSQGIFCEIFIYMENNISLIFFSSSHACVYLLTFNCSQVSVIAFCPTTKCVMMKNHNVM
jgi:hypothetical protein